MSPATPLEAALAYISRGWNPVPVPFRSKGPVDELWQTRVIDEATAPDFFDGGPQNIGVMLGPTSRGLTDIDLDTPEAIAIAPYLLPHTRAIFGRASKRASHWLYYTDLDVTQDKGAIRLQTPDQATLCEIRIGGEKGAQTVFPGSTHPSGEAVVWEDDGEPASTHGDELLRRVKWVAACALIARHWPTEGGRHDAALALGGFLARAGYSVKLMAEAIARAAGDPEWRDRVKAAEDAARNYAAGGNTYGLPRLIDIMGERAARRAAEWLGYDERWDDRRQDEQPAAPAAPLVFIDTSKWDDTPAPPREWAVHDRLPLRQPTLFSGEGAAGKTLIALQLAVAHVTGRDWLGTLPEIGPAIYVGCEDEADELHRRLADIGGHYGVRFVDLADLHLVSFAGKDALLGVADRSGIVKPTPLFTQLLEAARNIKPKQIVLDTVSDIFAGNENDRTQVRQFVALLRSLAIDGNTGVLMLSHPSLTGISSGTGLSGSTGWHNSVRARMYLRPATTADGEQPDPNLRELEFKKNNYGPLAEKIVLRWQDGVFRPVPSAGTMEKATADAKADNVFLDILNRFNRQDRYVNDKNGPTYAPALFAKEPEAKLARLGKAALADTMRRLFAANRLHLEPYGKPSRQFWRLVPGPKPREH